MTLGERISSLRKEKNMTQEELGSIFNVSRQAIQKWESDVSLPNIYTLRSVAEYFNVSIDYLIDGKESDAPKTNVIKEKNNDVIEYITMIVDLFCGLNEINVRFDDTSNNRLCEYDHSKNAIVVNTSVVIRNGLSISMIHGIIRLLFVLSLKESKIISSFVIISSNIFASKFIKLVYDVDISYDLEKENRFIEEKVDYQLETKYKDVIDILKDISLNYKIVFDTVYYRNDDYLIKLYLGLNEPQKIESSIEVVDAPKEQIVEEKPNEEVVKEKILKKIRHANENETKYKSIAYVFFGIFIMVYFIYCVIVNGFFIAIPTTFGFSIVVIIFIVLLAKRIFLKTGAIISCILTNASLIGTVGTLFLNAGYPFINGVAFGPLMCIPFDIGMIVLYMAVK